MVADPVLLSKPLEEETVTMPLTAVCPTCSTRYVVKDELAGKRAKCKKCGSEFAIRQMASSPPSGTKGMAAADDDDDEYKLAPAASSPAGAASPSKSVSADSGSKCPDCGAELQDGAVICVACGLDLRHGKKLTGAIGGDGDESKSKNQLGRIAAFMRPKGRKKKQPPSEQAKAKEEPEFDPITGKLVEEDEERRSRLAAEIHIAGITINPIVLVILLPIVGFGAYKVYRFLTPLPVAIVDIEAIEVFDAATGVHRSKTPLAKTNYAAGGRHSLVVTHPSEQGDYVLVDLEVSNTFIYDNSADRSSRKHILILTKKDVKLEIDGVEAEYDFLEPTEKECHATIDLFPAIEFMTDVASGGGIQYPGVSYPAPAGTISQGSDRIDTGAASQSPSEEIGLHGDYKFASAKGMNVSATTETTILSISCDEQSRTSLTCDSRQRETDYLDVAQWSVPILLKRPKNGGQLTVTIEGATATATIP
jgi:predicted Zn finger-like uncharacterized protein